MTHITLVYKQKSDGQLCRSCAVVQEHLQRNGFDGLIDRILVADERDPGGEAWELARRYNARSAPFFLVAQDGVDRIYTSYPRVISDVLQPQSEARPSSDSHDETVHDIL